ncbi:prosaposin-like [Pecten maximus]|uniref:prosaposin-like n=1 Tax=Pecten maximus TaxID=6579 RepID=UPI0014588532|nr:prosaposin-like [Pecten maximus]
MKLVVFLTLLGFVSVESSSLLGSSKCTWGPSYWCSHVSRAKECKAVDHCLQTVWTKQTVSNTDSSGRCKLCETFINMIREELKTNPDQAVNYIKKVCDILPLNQTFKTECINAVDDVEVVVKLLQSNMTAEALCGIFLPCSGFEDHVNQHKQPETNVLVPLVEASPVTAGNICTDCVNFMTDIKNLLTDPNTESQLIGMIKQIVCSQLGSVEAICDDLVDTYVPQGMSILSSYVDPQVTCSAVGFCTSKETEELRSKFNDMKNFVMVVLRKMGVHVTTNALECDACKAVASDIRKMARDPTIERKVVNFVEQNVCAHLGELANLCVQTVEDNYMAVFQLIAGSLIDDQVCVNLGMCPSSVGVAKLQLGTIECEACTSVIKALSLLESSTTVQNAVKNFIENDVCTKLGSSAGQCKIDVDMYSEAAFQILKEILNAGFLCSKMNLCASPAPKLTSNGALCEVCTAAATEVDNLLKSPDTQAKIESLLDNICERLGGNLSAECKTFVDEYAPFVLTMLAQELDPTTICKDIGLCPAKQAIKADPPKAISKTITTSSGCAVCEFLVKEVEDYLKQSATKEEIKNALYGLCNELASIKDECNTFLNVYFDIVYEMLLNETSPGNVCTTIKLCSAKKTPPPKTSPRLHVVPLLKETLPTKVFNLGVPTSSEECVVCEMVLNYVNEALKDPATEKDVRIVLDKACGQIPQNFQQQCKTFVDTYSDQIVQWAVEQDDPYVVCPFIHLCGTSQPSQKDTNLYFRKHMLVKKKCNQGPKYWCSSRTAAKNCGKENYCFKRNLVNNLV